MAYLTTTDISKSACAKAILDALAKRWPWIKHLFAGVAYDRSTLMDKAIYLKFFIEIIRRSEQQKGSHILPRRSARRGDLRLDDAREQTRARL